MTDEPVKKSKTKAAGLALLFAFSAVVALRIHHRGDSVKTQAAAPLSLLRAKEELNSAGDDFAHRQAKDVTKDARPFLSRKYDSEKNKRLGNMFDDQRNLQGSLSLSMMGTGDYLFNQGKGKGKSGKDPSKPDTSKAGKSKDDWKPASEEKGDDEWKTSKASKSQDDWKPAGSKSSKGSKPINGIDCFRQECENPYEPVDPAADGRNTPAMFDDMSHIYIGWPASTMCNSRGQRLKWSWRRSRHYAAANLTQIPPAPRLSSKLLQAILWTMLWIKSMVRTSAVVSLMTIRGTTFG